MDYSTQRQLEYCYAQESITDDQELTIWAIGGFMPSEKKDAEIFIDDGKMICTHFGKPLSQLKLRDVIKIENEFRIATVRKLNDFINTLKASNCSIRQAVTKSGISRAQADTYRARFVMFAQLWDEVFESVTDKLEEAGFRRAVTGVDRTVFYRGVKVGTEKVYSDSLLAMMLQGRRKDIYRQNVATELTGKGGESLYENASDEQIDALLKRRLEALHSAKVTSTSVTAESPNESG